MGMRAKTELIESELTPKAAAAALGCSVQTVTRLIESGRLRAVNRGAGRHYRGYRIAAASVEKLKETRP